MKKGIILVLISLSIVMVGCTKNNEIVDTKTVSSNETSTEKVDTKTVTNKL